MNIFIPYKIYEQIQFYVDKSEVECSGLGKVVISPTGYQVTEVCLLKQENTGVHTEIDANAVTKAMFTLRNSEGGLYFWWHSHVNMGVFWSGTDKATIEEIGANGLCVAVVFNKKNERKGAVWLKGHELSPNLYFDDIPVKIEHDGASAETKALWSKDFEEKCTTRHFNYDGGKSTINPLKFQGSSDYFDLMDFEAKYLTKEASDKLAFLSNDIMYGATISIVDNALKETLAIIKGSKASKHEKKQAYKEYKDMALETKNELKERFEAWGNMYGAQ
jgi:hypothetical protein